MQKLSVNYSISRTVALTEGRADYGTASYQPSDTELQFLCIADRAYLDSHERECFTLPTATPPAWPVIADAIKAARLAAEADTARRAAEQAVRIEAALAKPDDEWIFRNYHRGTFDVNIPGFSTWLNTPEPVRIEPRIAARLESLRPEIERRNAEVRAQQAAVQAKRETEQADKDAAKAAALESLTAWALASDDAALARAAKDGYEVANAVLARVAMALALEVCGEVSTEGTKHWARWNFEDRAAPSALAFEAYDHTKLAVEALDKPAGMTVALQKIARVTVDAPDDDPDGQADIFTAVVVMLSVPGTGCKDRAVIVKVDK